MSWYLTVYTLDIEQTNKYPCVRKKADADATNL